MKNPFKLITLGARLLLGLIFVVFSLNFWLGFIPVPLPPEGSQAATFMGAIIPSGYLGTVKILELIAGLMLLSGFFVNLGLAILGPIAINIVFYHVFLLQGGYPMAAAVGILSVIALSGQRKFINTLLEAK